MPMEKPTSFSLLSLSPIHSLPLPPQSLIQPPVHPFPPTNTHTTPKSTTPHKSNPHTYKTRTHISQTLENHTTTPIPSHQHRNQNPPQKTKGNLTQKTNNKRAQARKEVKKERRSTHHPSGKYLLTTNGIFLSLSSFSAISKGSVSPSRSTKTGAFMLLETG